MQVVRCKNDACGKAVTVKDELVGRKVMCPHCRTPMIATLPTSTAVQAIPAARADQPQREDDDQPPPSQSRGRGADESLYVAVLSIPYAPNYAVLATAIFSLVLGVGGLWTWPQGLASLYQRFLTLLTLSVGIIAMTVFIVQLFNRRTLVLDRKALKLRKGNQVEGRIPYDNIALVEICEMEGEEGAVSRAIKVQLREPDDPDSDWPNLKNDDHILIDEGLKRPLGEICDLIQERSPRLIEVRPHGKRKRLGPKSHRPRRWTSGMVTLAIVGPIAAALLLLSMFFIGAAALTMLLSLLLLTASCVMVFLLVHKKSGQYDLSETLRTYNPVTLLVGFGRQFYWAQRLPRVFVPWLILEGLGLMLLIFSGNLLGRHAQPPPPPPVAAGRRGPPVIPVDPAKLQGVWEGSTNNNGLKEVWTITENKGAWSVVCKYFSRDGREVGSFHAEDSQVQDGELVFRTVFDRPPIRNWESGGSNAVRLLDDNTIQVAWRDRHGWTGGGELVRQQPPNIDPPAKQAEK